MNVSFIIATIGRPSLARTLASIETRPGDEILVVADEALGLHTQPLVLDNPQVRFIHCPPGGDFGHAERNFAMPLAKGNYMAHIDDDDYYVAGCRALMQDAIENTPDRPVIFRMKFPNGIVLWQTQELRCGNLGTPCIVHPNDQPKLGVWGPFVGGDFHFLETSKWAAEDYVWRPEVIAMLGHNIGG